MWSEIYNQLHFHKQPLFSVKCYEWGSSSYRKTVLKWKYFVLILDKPCTLKSKRKFRLSKLIGNWEARNKTAELSECWINQKLKENGRQVRLHFISFIKTKRTSLTYLRGIIIIKMAFSCTCHPNKNEPKAQRIRQRINPVTPDGLNHTCSRAG